MYNDSGNKKQLITILLTNYPIGRQNDNSMRYLKNYMANENKKDSSNLDPELKDTSGTNTIFGSIIQNIYNTIFTISIAFFGVVVGIMALKLAISSIASEKAKYKQAITNWLLALILLFTAHYLISFIFFVNEKMV